MRDRTSCDHKTLVYQGIEDVREVCVKDATACSSSEISWGLPPCINNFTHKIARVNCALYRKASEVFFFTSKTFAPINVFE